MSNFFGLINRWKVPAVIVLTSGYVAYDTYRMKNSKDSEICVELKGKPVMGILGDAPCISPTLQEIIDQVKPTLNLPQTKKKVLNYHVTPYTQPKINGFYSSFSTIDIFLPDYFNISSGEQLTAPAIRNFIELMGESFDSMGKDDWLTPDGKAFINSFLLSDRAKKYLITRASYSNLNPEYHLKYIIISLVTLGFIASLALIEERAKGNFGVKFLLSLLIIVPLILLKNLLSGHANLLCESKGIAQAISRNMLTYKELVKTQDVSLIDEEMLLGALEYHSKLLQRNKAASRLFGGFNVFGMISDDGENVNPFKLTLPNAEVIKQLERLHSLLKIKQKSSTN